MRDAVRRKPQHADDFLTFETSTSINKLCLNSHGWVAAKFSSSLWRRASTENDPFDQTE